MCLSEAVYKVVDYGEERASEILAAIIAGFPPGMVSIRRVEWSQPDAQHRCEGAVLCWKRPLLPACMHSHLHVTACCMHAPPAACEACDEGLLAIMGMLDEMHR